MDDLPEIRLDIRFKHLQKLYEKRDQALASGLLVQADDDFVPAMMQLGQKQYRIKLRLKGDLSDHLETDKWSFRIRVRGGDAVFGMRRFSVQHPATRGFQSEMLFFETLRMMDVLAPRFFFVNVVVNGDNVGIMALEEHFSKELLEANRRREGVIVRFDESLFWESSAAGTEPINDFRTATIDAFASNKISESPFLAEQFRVAVGLLRGFIDGRLSASDVFDAVRIGRYLAAAELWGAWHAMRWHNLRFYLNPITMKLEPIAFDADLQSRHHRSRDAADGILARTEPIALAMLSDKAVFREYRKAIDQLAENIRDGSLREALQDTERSVLPALHREYFFLGPYPYQELENRGEFLRTRTDAQLLTRLSTPIVPVPPDREGKFLNFVRAYLVESESRHYLEIINPQRHAIEIDSIRWIKKTDGGETKLEAAPDLTFPILVPGTAGGQNGPVGSMVMEFLPPENLTQSSLELVSRLSGDTQTALNQAIQYFPPIDRHPIPNSSAEEQVESHSFLELDSDDENLRVRRGDWLVEDYLIVPEGFGLVIEEGTKLRFTNGGAIVSHGHLQLLGTDANPIYLTGDQRGGADPAWQGLVVLEADTGSLLKNVVLSDTAGINMSGWQLTGGTTFYRSDVEMSHGGFSGTRAEDALNVIHSEFTLKDVDFSDTVSDALDVDFGNGTILNGTYTDIGSAGGGDAVDISGSKVLLKGTHFTGISDKAISVGEGSRMTASAVSIEQAGTGAASKDGSFLDISDSTLGQIKVAGLMSYIKKPEFGPARIRANNITFIEVAHRARVQNDNSVTIDGETIPTEALDVDELYQTAMKKGARQ